MLFNLYGIQEEFLVSEFNEGYFVGLMFQTYHTTLI
jgi:hypothetical protein